VTVKKIEMKNVLIILLFFFMMISISTGADIMTLSENVSIKSVIALRVIEAPPVLKIILTLRNESDQKISVKNAQFEVIINPENSSPMLLPDEPDSLKKMVSELGGKSDILPDSKLELGKTDPVSFDLEPCNSFDSKGNCISPGEADMEVNISLPDYDKERNLIIYKLLNYIGLPGSRKEICLIGNIEAALQGKEGKKYGRFNMELYYKPPRIQSEVLFFGW